MITIEECIVQNLYYRLVLITVRRSNPVNTKNTGTDSGESSADGAGTSGVTVENDELIPSQECRDETFETTQVHEIYEQENVVALTHPSPSKGLGFLYLGPLDPRTSVGGGDSQMLVSPDGNHGMLPSDSATSRALLKSMNLPGGEQICVTRQVRTILDAGDARLQQALLEMSNSTSDGTNSVVPMWQFGSTTHSDETNGTSSEVALRTSDNSIVPSDSYPCIDLRSCDQFSVIRLEDIRNPSSQSIMMVQAGESNGSHNTAQKLAAAKEVGALTSYESMDVNDNCDNGSVHNSFSKVSGATGSNHSGVQSESLTNGGMLYVEDSGAYKKHDMYYLHSTDHQNHLQISETSRGDKESVQEMDSGVWDMMHALESASGGQQLFASGGNRSSHVDLFRTTSLRTDECNLDVSAVADYNEDRIMGDLHRSPSDELQGSYRMFQISDNGMATQNDGATNGNNSKVSDVDTGARQVSTVPTASSAVEKARGGLSELLQPMAVVNFVVHRVEAPILRLETVVNGECSAVTAGETVVDMSKILTVDTNLLMSPANGSAIDTCARKISKDTQPLLKVVSPIEHVDPVTKLCDEIENLSVEEQASVGEFCLKRIPGLKSPTITSPLPPHSTKFDDREEDEETEHRTSHEIYRDIVEIKSVHVAARSLHERRPRREGPDGTSFSSTRKCRSERSSPRTSQLVHVDEFQRNYQQIPRSANVSPTQYRFAIGSPTGDIVMANSPLRSSSPASWPVAGKDARSHGPASRTVVDRKYEYMDNSCDGLSVATTADSSIGRVHDEPEEIIEFERFSEWMKELPEELHSLPLSSLSIPGSHICVAIDRDMRVDMDFSKCNYEMADFLRKLPNLEIFNAFRAQMKAVWKAWMPKQCLSIHDQLEAGSRYLDIRVTKYLSAFYGEHGLYTRQLKKYLKEIRLFVEEHPSEVIILHFELADHLDRADKRRLVTVLFQVFGAKMACSTGKDHECPSLQWMWSNRKQLIIYFADQDMEAIRNHIFGSLVWTDDAMDVLSPKKTSIVELITSLKESFTKLRPDIALPSNRLHVTKAVLSPDMSMVFGKFHHRSMKELARTETADAVAQWLQRHVGRLNVVTIDFVGVGDVVKNILHLNHRMLERVTDV